MSEVYISTTNLILRSWQESDTEPFIQLNNDPQVMEFFPSILQPTETLQQIERFQQHFKNFGYGFFAVERKDNHEFIGFTGFSHPKFDCFFTPCVEIGWRYSKENWGQGFATEAAKACIDYGFKYLNLKDIYAFTALQNIRSALLMQRIGMHFITKFNHPLLQENNPLSTHLLYRISYANNINICDE
jgi:RimJ/RimL family protein N-acetyltransferase